MTAAVTDAPSKSGAAARSSGGNTLAGTGTLLRFYLRRDRIRLPVWILALFLSTLSTLSSYESSYPDAKDRQSSADSMDSPAGLAMTGPERYLDDYNYGSMLSHQMLGFIAIMIGLMSVLIITRHTRTEEETNRAELLRSTVVGRHACLTAAMITAVIANVILGLLTAVGVNGSGLYGVDGGGALLFGACYALVGITFAGIAAITAQVTPYSRGASGMALAVIGVAYALRAAGDVGSGAISWLSPIGWIQRTYVFVDDRWWPLLLNLALAVGATIAAYALSTRRDVGSGLRAARAGRAHATEALPRPVGLALRLQRGILMGFSGGLILLGVMYGSILGDAEEMIKDVEALKDAVERMGGATVTESFASTVMILLAVVASIYVVMAALRPRSEETSGRAEPLLSTGLSRTAWVGGHLTVAMAGGFAVLLVGGLAFGASGAAATDDGGLFGDLLMAALVYTPALWVTAGVGVVIFGWFPRASSFTWAVPIYAFVVGYLGQLLDFPEWMNNTSPFGHVPQLPADDLNWTPLLVLTVLAAGLVALGLAGFRRRDLETK